jgi:O-antigen/teichoic acid export membrane protein
MKHSLTVKTGIITASRAFRVLGLLVLNMVLARGLTTSAYGTYQQVWLVYAMGFPIFMLGIPASLYYFLQHVDAARRGSLITNSMLLLLFSGLVMSVFTAVGAGVIGGLFGNNELILPLRIFSVYAMFTISTLWAEPLYISTNRHVVVLLLSLVSTIGLLASVIPLAVLGKPLALIFAAVVSFSAIRFIILSYLLAREKFGARRGPDLALARNQIGYSVPVGGSEIIASVSKSVDKVVVSRVFSPSTYAVYANGAMEVPVSGLLVGAISAVIWPSLSRMHGEGRKKELLSVWFNTTDKTAFFVMPIFFFFMFFAPEIMVVLFSDTYVASASPFRVHLLVLPLRIAQYAVLLLAMGATRAVFYGSVGDLVVKLALSLVLVRPLGYLGPAVAVVCSTWLEVYYYLTVGRRLLSVKIGRILPWGRLARTCLIAGVACGFGSSVKLSPLDPLLRVLLGGFVSAASYLLLSYSFARASMPRIVSRERES